MKSGYVVLLSIFAVLGGFWAYFNFSKPYSVIQTSPTTATLAISNLTQFINGNYCNELNERYENMSLTIYPGNSTGVMYFDRVR